MRRIHTVLFVAVIAVIVGVTPAPAEPRPAPRSVPRFDPYQTYAVGSWAESVAIGDVNSDGRQDVLLSTSFYFDPDNDFKLFEFLQQPDGTLAYPPIKLVTDGQYADKMGLATGDLNGDGHTDVALATSSGIDVYLQGPTGLTGPYLQPVGGKAREVLIADVNSDGKLDMVTNSTVGVQVLINRGRWFKAHTISAKVEWDLEVADLNADGLPDIVGCEGLNLCAPILNVFAQASHGTFTETDYDATVQYYPTGYGVAVGDFNADGYQDAALSIPGNTPNGLVNVLFQVAGTGTLGSPQVNASYDIPNSLIGADVDGDGNTDTVTVHGGWGEVGLYYQQPDGSIGPEVLYPVPTPDWINVKGLAVGDFSGDGLADIAFAGSGALDVLRQSP